MYINPSFISAYQAVGCTAMTKNYSVELLMLRDVKVVAELLLTTFLPQYFNSTLLEVAYKNNYESIPIY